MIDKHEETIKCPECGTCQTAEVLHTFPWWSYVHTCVKCKYVIMESEWETKQETNHITHHIRNVQ